MCKKSKILTLFVVLFKCSQLFAEPFFSPHYPFFRHELRLLQDYGSINSNINKWPLNLGGLNAVKGKNNWNKYLMGQKLKSESRFGWEEIKNIKYKL